MRRKCDECGGVLFYVNEQEGKDGFLFVVYTCKKCSCIERVAYNL